MGRRFEGSANLCHSWYVGEEKLAKTFHQNEEDPSGGAIRPGYESPPLVCKRFLADPVTSKLRPFSIPGHETRKKDRFQGFKDWKRNVEIEEA